MKTLKTDGYENIFKLHKIPLWQYFCHCYRYFYSILKQFSPSFEELKDGLQTVEEGQLHLGSDRSAY